MRTGVAINRVKGPVAESPRFPAQRSSAQGESAPKVRARAVADGNRVNIPEPPAGAMWGRRRLCELAIGCASEACRWIPLGNPGGRYHRGAAILARLSQKKNQISRDDAPEARSNRKRPNAGAEM